MHFFLLFVAVLAFVLNVDAAAILNKRASPDVQSCIVDINQVSAQLGTVETTMNSKGVADMKKEYLRFQSTVETASKSCCAIHRVVNDADADEFLTSLSHLQPTVEKFVATIASKRNQYTEVPNFAILLGMNGVDIASNELYDCFVKFTPASRNSTLQEYHDSIHSTLLTAADNYPI